MKTSSALLLALLTAAMPLRAQLVHILTTDGKLATAPVADFSSNTTPITLAGITAGETLVAIDMRPQNQRLYALGVNATTNTATLYHVSTQTGSLGVVGVASGIAYTTDGVIAVDLPDPATAQYDIDFNPSVDRLRVVTSTGLNFRINPNTGAPVDGNAGVAGTNTDGAINGGTTSLSATAYTNNQPNNGGITTQYAVDAATDSLYIQNPPNNGTQTGGLAITLGGNPLDFTQTSLDISPNVNAAASNTPVASGTALMVANVGGTTGLYQLDLVSGAATLADTTTLDVRSSAIATTLSAANALDGTAANLVRFDLSTPGSLTTVAISGLTAGETLVGLDSRPATGQLYALGVNFGANNATLYLVDPQSAALTAIGAAGSIVIPSVTLPDPASAGYGMDFNPTVDRIRVITSTGLNFRINPITGVLATPTADTNLNGSATAATSAAYTNNFGGATATTQYVFNSNTGSLYIQNPPNDGTLSFVGNISFFDFSAKSGFDIPPSVAVNTSGTAASGFGWALIGRSGGFFTQLYRINLADGTGQDVGGLFGAVQSSGLVAWASSPDATVSASGGNLANNSSFSFGAAPGAAQITRTFTVKNDGSQPLTYQAALNTGTAFSITQNPIGIVNGNSSATFEVTYNASAAQTQTDTLVVTTNAPNQATINVTLTAPGLVPAADDEFSVTSGDTYVTPLANDGFDDSYFLDSVSDPLITILGGRGLLIPDGYNGTFTYNITDGTNTAQATVNVTAATPVVAPKNFTGLLYGGGAVGCAKATISKGIATISIVGGPTKIKAKVPVGGATYTNLGYLTLDQLPDNQLEISIGALGGNIGGVLRPARLTATAEKHNIALASIEPALFPGGGFATATVSTKAAIKIVGISVDGVPFSAASLLNDNASFTFFAAAKKGLKAPAYISGELFAADLAKTDVTGELDYIKFPQLPTAINPHRNGVTTTLTANGCRFPGINAIVAGNGGTLQLIGGDLVAPETTTVDITAGVPVVPTGSLLTWKANAKSGTFTATVTVPNAAKPVKAAGIYLPKSDNAWGYFPGTTEGGSINLIAP